MATVRFWCDAQRDRRRCCHGSAGGDRRFTLTAANVVDCGGPNPVGLACRHRLCGGQLSNEPTDGTHGLRHEHIRYGDNGRDLQPAAGTDVLDTAGPFGDRHLRLRLLPGHARPHQSASELDNRQLQTTPAGGQHQGRDVEIPQPLHQYWRPSERELRTGIDGALRSRAGEPV